MSDIGLQLRSLVKDNNTLELSLVEVEIPQPGPDEVLVRVDATPSTPPAWPAARSCCSVLRTRLPQNSAAPLGWLRGPGPYRGGLQPGAITVYGKQATGEKLLIEPHR